MTDVRCDFHSLPPQRRKVIEFIHDHAHVHERLPSDREIAEHMGWRKVSSAGAAKRQLVSEGFLRKTVVRGRAVFSIREAAE